MKLFHTSPLVDDDLDEEEAIRETEKKNLENVVEDETLEIDKIVNIKESRNHPLENVIGNLNQRTLRSQTQSQNPQPGNIKIIGTKWVFRNKLDENGVVSRNKARLVAQGYNQQEGIDYDETYAPVAKLESIRMLLAYACALDYKLFQMDVKSAFLNGFINEEVYMALPPGFIDFEKPDHVYKLKKALYGLKQAPKAWYDRLKAFLIKHKYKMGMVDNTLFTKKKSSNLIIVQIYIDDIIFGLTCQDMCDEFAKIMHDEFEMSMMGELNFFLGLQIKQMEDGETTLEDELRKLRVQSKEHHDSLIAQINAKSVENSDLNAQLQEKVFAIISLKNELRKLKGKYVVNTVVSKPNATLAPGMFKLDIKLISPKLKNNRDAHEVYIEKTIEYTDTLRGFVEHDRTQYPSEPLLESACMFTKHVQELLVYASQTYPNSPKPSEKLVAIESLKTKDSNKPLLTSTVVKPTTSASGSKPSGNTKNNRITQPPRNNQKNKVENLPRKVKSSLNKTNSVSEPISNAFVKHFVRNAKFESICAVCNKCLFDANHDMCLVDFVNDVNVVEIVLWYLDFRCSKHMTWNRSQLMHFVSKFLRTIRFRNDQVAKIMGCGDYQKGNVIISRVYYVEGLRHNLFSVGQFCDADLEVSFRKNTCFIQNLEGIDLLLGSRDINLYIISLDDMLKTSPICLLSKASKTKSWLWHHRLSYLNFGTLNKLATDGLARGIPKLKFQKDHLCPAYALGKSKKSSHQPKAEDTNQEKLYLLHMDLLKNQVKDNKIDLEQFVISEDESINSAFARFNTIITSLKTLDEGYSSKNYVKKFLKALHPTWRAKVTAIEESKDLMSLSLD
ncbi:retrovirus-related pol polyprotein from transposon TNT 1-94 [Tanacetum coccineum]